MNLTVPRALSSLGRCLMRKGKFSGVYWVKSTSFGLMTVPARVIRSMPWFFSTIGLRWSFGR